MFKKNFKFRSGYVIIKVIGKNKERFVNLCMENGFGIGGVTPADDGLELEISNADFVNIRFAARECGVKIKIAEKRGMAAFLRKHRYRAAIPVLAAATAVFFAVMPKYIWCVEIEGAKNADIDGIIRILSDKNVYPGAKKKDMADLSEIKNAVVFGDENVNWAWLYIDGAKATLKIQEGTAAPETVDKTTPATIIAAHDGYVRYAEVKRGERRVSAGDAVSRGDILVCGKVPVYTDGSGEKYSYVNSEARIIADTVHTETGKFSDTETLSVRTGKSKRKISVSLFGREYFPAGKPNDVFEKSDITKKNYDLSVPRAGYIGIGLSIYDIYELNEHENKLTEDEVLLRAKEKLEERICKKLGTEARREEEKLTYGKNGGEYTVTLRMNFRENIGIKIPQEE